MHAMPVVRIAAGSMLALTAFAAAAQNGPLTTEHIGKDPSAIRQEAEQQRSHEMQQQQQRSQDQANQQYNDIVRQNQSRAAADAAQGEAVRRSWAQKPPLAPDHNPLLGRWQSHPPGQRNAAGLSPEMAQLANALIGNITSGICDSMLGRGTVEFRPNGVVAIGADGRERPMYRADYRGEGSRVVVLPQGGTSFTHMIVDFSGNDRATVAAVGCGLTRAGAATAKAARMETSLAAGSGGGAPQWMHVASSPKNGGMDMYVSIASIRRAGDKARMLDLIDFKTRQSFEGKPFLSARNELEFDCTTPRQRMLGSTGFSGHMGTGTVVASSEIDGPWQAVGSSGPGFDHWQTACKQR